MSKFVEYCSHCEGEVKFDNKGFVIYQCPNCKNKLFPCLLCDAWTDNEIKIYTQNRSQYPFERSQNAI